MKYYTNMDELLGTVLEVEHVLDKLGETPFELLREEQEENWSTSDIIIEKNVKLLNESLKNLFKR